LEKTCKNCIEKIEPEREKATARNDKEKEQSHQSGTSRRVSRRERMPGEGNLREFHIRLLRREEKQQKEVPRVSKEARIREKTNIASMDGCADRPKRNFGM